MGIQYVGCELELKFHNLAQENVKLHRRKWEIMGYPIPILLCGDSRHLSQVLQEADFIATSPPFAGIVPHQDKDFTKRLDGSSIAGAGLDYGTSPGQIGRMKAGNIDGVVCSPPYAEGLGHGGEPTHKGKEPDRNLDGMQSGYGNTKGNIGNERNDTYWEAMRDVLSECHKILKPGGVTILVLKAYIKGGRKVHLPQQTLKLLIHLEFTPLERIKAMLVKETVTPGLFGEIKKVTERKSFFRRLHEKKRPDLKIDFEEIIICRK